VPRLVGWFPVRTPGPIKNERYGQRITMVPSLVVVDVASSSS